MTKGELVVAVLVVVLKVEGVQCSAQAVKATKDVSGKKEEKYALGQWSSK